MSTLPSEYNLMDIIESPDEEEINIFCKRWNFEVTTFKKGCFAGNVMAIDKLAKIMIEDIDNNYKQVNNFHRNIMLNILYWHNDISLYMTPVTGKDKLPDSFLLLTHMILYPTAKMSKLHSRANRDFVASFSALAKSRNNGKRNKSLVARGLTYITPGAVFRNVLRDVNNYFAEERVIAAEANYEKKLGLAGAIMKRAVAKIQDRENNKSHKNIIDKQVGNMVWLGEIIDFDQLYDIAKKD